MKQNSPAQDGKNPSGHEANFSRQVSAIIEKFEREFRSQEPFVAEFEGEAELERRRAEFERELWLLRVHLLEERPSIDYDDGEELKEMLANKLAVSSPNKVHPSDWWWTPAPADPPIQEILVEVQQALEKETKSKAQPWRRGVFYAWSVLSELVYLVLIIGVFSVAGSKFETIAFSVLVMIYNTVSTRISCIDLGIVYLMQRLEEAYGQVGRALGLKVSVSPAREAGKQIGRSGIAALIHNVSIGVGSLIALWHLVTAILSSLLKNSSWG
jgi:hypothetical protein